MNNYQKQKQKMLEDEEYREKILQKRKEYRKILYGM